MKQNTPIASTRQFNSCFTSVLRTLTLILILLLGTPSRVLADQNDSFSRKKLIADARQMSDLLENVHPQPYFKGGGKIAFHQRFQDILKAIPENGMTREDFRGLLSPLAASVGDGHTHIYPDLPLDFSGVPLLFYVVEKYLYVSAVVDEENEYLIGARLTSVEGVSLAEIARRTRLYYGADNIYGTLAQLANFELFLAKKHVLKDLLPEWMNHDHVNASFLMPDGSTRNIRFNSHPRQDYHLFRPGDGLDLPSFEGSEFGWVFLSENKDIAYLRVKGMTKNRETYEKRRTYSDVSEEVRELYRRMFNTEPVESVEGILEKIPSISEAFRDMVVEMKRNQTHVLIVDLRTNVGGWALSADMLIYYLYGKDALIELHRRTNIAVRKLSSYYLQSEPEEYLDEINTPSGSGEPSVELREQDYDFRDYDKMEDGLLDKKYARKIVENDLALSKTFFEEYSVGEFSKYYCPDRVFVVTDVATFSAGFMFAKYLELMGAVTVGTTPSQNTMQMGETVHFELENSKLKGNIAHSFLVHDTARLNSPDGVELLTPKYELTYEKLKEYEFTRHAVIQYILELLGSEA